MTFSQQGPLLNLNFKFSLQECQPYHDIGISTRKIENFCEVSFYSGMLHH
jgi:hypothetical protein